MGVDTPIPHNTIIKASFNKSSNTGRIATNNNTTINFEAEDLLLMNEPPYETNYNVLVEMITNNHMIIASFSESSNTVRIATNNNTTINFEADNLLLAHE